MVAVFVYELVLNSREQGTPVSFKVGFRNHATKLNHLMLVPQPVVNPMLGPSQVRAGVSSNERALLT